MLKGLGLGTMALALASKVQALALVLALRDEALALALRLWPWLHHCSEITGHSYADDMQVSIHIHNHPCIRRMSMQQPTADECWENAVIAARYTRQLDKVSTTELSLFSARIQVSTTVSNFGVLIDGQLSMANHVASLCRSCLSQLRQLRLARSSLTSEAAKTLMHAYVSNRLD